MRALSVLFLTVLSLMTVSCRDNLRPAEVGTFNMGERAQIGPLIYTVIDTRWAISLGAEPTPRIPTNRFFIINISIVNSGAEPSTVPTFTLIDDAGQAYQELDNGEGVQDWLGFVRRVRPAESAQGTIVFDVPQKRFKLRVADEQERFGFISIPLSLGDVPVDLTAPKGPGR